jgi:hypothetical protein
VGQAIFYNMTSMSITLTVNNNPQDSISPLPGSSPYTPNHSQQTYTRYDTAQPQADQFGTTNRVSYTLDGGAGGSITVTLNVNFHAYSENQDILLYLFKDAIVATVLSDNNAYLGHNGDTVVMNPQGEATLL